MKIEDRRMPKGFRTVDVLNYGDVFEYEGWFYRKIRAENGRVSIFVDGTVGAYYCVVVNLKSGTCRPIKSNTHVQQVHGRVVIERNA